MPIFSSFTSTQLSQAPKYHVYSHYGCRSEDVDDCAICKYLLQPNTYLHSNLQSFVIATQHSSLPSIQRQLASTSIKPLRYRIDDENDLYILKNISGSSKTRQQAEDAAIIDICLNDKSINRIILVDAEEENNGEDDDVLYVRLYDLEKCSC